MTGDYIPKTRDELIEKINDLQATIDELRLDEMERTQPKTPLHNDNLYRAIVDGSMDGFCVLDLKGHIIDTNDAYCRILGYTRNILISMNIADIDLQKTFDINRFLNRTDRFETQYRHKDGSIVDVEVSITFTQTSNHFFSFIRDITERKLTEAALQKSEALHNHAQQIAQLGHWGWDIQTNALNWSDEVYRIFRQTKGEFTPTVEAFETALHPEDKEAFLEQRNKDLQEKGSFFLDHRIVLPDGEVRWVQERAQYVNEKDSGALQILGTAQDITRNKQNEDMLWRLQMAVEQSPVSIVITDRNGSIEYVNPKFVAVTGYTFEESIGKNPNILKSDNKTEEEYRLLWDTILSGEQWRGEFRNRKKNGELFLESAVISPIRNTYGDITHFLAIKADITEQRRLENEAQDAAILRIEVEKDKEIIVLKERILSVMSHQFRTPLAIIQTSSDLLSRYQDKITEERRQQSLKQISEQVVKLTAMIDEILEISRANSGKTEYNPSPIDIDAFCHNIFDEIRFTDTQNHHFEYNSNLKSKHIEVDGNLLRHIINNLLTNATKYTPAGGAVRLDLDQNEQHVILRVYDEGIGIPQEDINHLFEPFHRATNAKHIQGTGLGLAIAKEYLELHRGQITVESELHKGSIFTITLPITP